MVQLRGREGKSTATGKVMPEKAPEKKDMGAWAKANDKVGNKGTAAAGAEDADGEQAVDEALDGEKDSDIDDPTASMR